MPFGMSDNAVCTGTGYTVCRGGGGGGGGGRDADGGNMYIVMTSVQANGPHYHHTAHITLQ